MILIQTMCNKPGGKHCLESCFRLSEQSGTLGLQQKLEECCRARAVAVSDNVHNSASPWIVPDLYRSRKLIVIQLCDKVYFLY